MNENVNVCITPKGDKPVLHFSQFDNENVFTVTVLADDGESAAVLTGLDIEFRLRKTDSHVVTIAPESVADNVITFKTTEQLCACCGQNIATVTLMKDDMVISTLNILVDIQRDILSGGFTSESDIRNLTTQIEQIVPEVIGDDYYTKTEVDELIADIPTFDPSNYYNKSDVDGLLADKADAADVYTKTETDNLLADKADADDVYAKSEVYNKTETDNLLSAKMDNIGYNGIVDDAAIISFNTDSEAPLAIIKGNITPVQSGSGTPSPDNVRPISGFSALNVTRTGVNLFDGVYPSIANTIKYLPVKVGDGDFTLSTDMPLASGAANLFFLAGNVNTGAGTASRVVTGEPKTVTSSGGYVTIAYRNYNSVNPENYNTMLCKGTSTTYIPYNGQSVTVNFGQTVYGGVADVTNGKVTLTHGIITLDGTQTPNLTNWRASGTSVGFAFSPSDIPTKIMTSASEIANIICDKLPTDAYGNLFNQNVDNAISGSTNSNYSLFIRIADTSLTTAAAVQTYLANNPLTVVYELATPIEITTTPVTVSSIAGDNNIYIDTGNLTEIAYFEDVEDNLIKLIKACQI